MDDAAAEVFLRENPGGWGDGGAGAEVAWCESDYAALGEAVAEAADTGVLLMLSRSQDGGALMVAVMHEGDRQRRWFHGAADAVAAVAAIPAYVDGLARRSPSPTRAAKRQPRPAKRR